MIQPLRLAFLGCGFITQVHSRHLKASTPTSSAATRAATGRRPRSTAGATGGAGSYADYAAAIDDPRVDAVVIAVPPRFHLDLTLQALAAGKHVLVEKPAFPRLDDYRTVVEARDRAKRVVLVGENDHYKPLAVVLRRLLAEGAIGEMVFAHFTTIAKRLKTADDWRNDETMAGGDAFFEEGIHWLHLAGSLGPADRRRSTATGRRRRARARTGAQEHDGGVPLRQRRRRLALLLARDSVALQGAAAVEAVRPRGHHHVRVERRCSSLVARHAACRGSSSRASATSAATRRCIATSRAAIARRAARRR